MTCPICTAARTGDPADARMTNGCDSCTGRVLAAMRFTRDQIVGKHPPAVIAAFDDWAARVRQFGSRAK